jgi:hypothetical protein
MAVDGANRGVRKSARERRSARPPKLRQPADRLESLARSNQILKRLKSAAPQTPLCAVAYRYQSANGAWKAPEIYAVETRCGDDDLADGWLAI